MRVCWCCTCTCTHNTIFDYYLLVYTGLQFVRQLVVPEYNSVELEIASKSDILCVYTCT